MSVAAFRQRYSEKSLALFNEKPDDYHSTVATTWSIAFDEILSIPLASDILNVIAWLAPDDIPRILFNAWDIEQVDEAIKTLIHYSLINATEESISVHRLVQTVIQERLKAENASDQWLAKAIEVVDQGYPQGNFDNYPSTWPLCERLQTHGLVLKEHINSRTDLATFYNSNLYNRMGVYYGLRADYNQAKSFYQASLDLAEIVYSSDHEEVAIRVNNLGGVLMDLGDLSAACAAYERALTIFEMNLGEDHQNLATCVNNLGLVLKNLGDLSGARAAYERALKIDEAVYGPDHGNVARDVNNLGVLFFQLGDLSGARAAVERALKIDEAVYGHNHPNVARDVNNLGALYYQLGEYREARKYFIQAYDINNSLLGPEHPNTRTAKESLDIVENRLEL